MTTQTGAPMPVSYGAAASGQTAASSMLNGVPIKLALTYLDTVWIWIPRYLETWERHTLKSLCGCLTYRPALRASETDRWMWLLGYRVRLVLQQPTDKAFKFLQERLSGPLAPLINRVDVALDLICGSQADAEQLQSYIAGTLYKPYHRKAHGVTDYRDTIYIGFKNGYNKCVIYSDRPSRHN